MNIEPEQPAKKSSVVIIVDSDEEIKPIPAPSAMQQEDSVMEITNIVQNPAIASDPPKNLPMQKKKSNFTAKQTKKDPYNGTTPILGYPKKRKSKQYENVIDIDNFIPEQLQYLDHMKHKNLVRVGENYQATIPSTTDRQLYCITWEPYLVWNSKLGFSEAAYELFKEKFGERRTQEELCEILVNNRCSWEDIPQILETRKKYYRQLYNEKDRNAAYK